MTSKKWSDSVRKSVDMQLQQLNSKLELAETRRKQH